ASPLHQGRSTIRMFRTLKQHYIESFLAFPQALPHCCNSPEALLPQGTEAPRSGERYELGS
ncbi:MAG: hypothetical protein IIW61_02040, partial [Bacteroidaceae bacterium]|nr:hypothetical protein [Bacteroidaceae bacterium]